MKDGGERGEKEEKQRLRDTADQLEKLIIDAMK